MEEPDQEVSGSGNDAGRGDGQNPRPDDAASDAPPDSAQSVCAPNAYDRARYGVSGTDGNSCESSPEQGDGARCLGAEAPNGLELGDLRTHSVDDAPPAEVRTKGYGRVSRQYDRPVQPSP